MQESDKKEARELLIKSKIYRLLAIVFAVVGLGLFMFLFFQYFEDNLVGALKDPLLIVFIVFPFMPSVLLSLKAKKAEKALTKLLTPGS